MKIGLLCFYTFQTCHNKISSCLILWSNEESEFKESKEKHQYNISTVEEEAERWYYIKRNWKTNLAGSNWGLDKNSASWWLGFQVEDAYFQNELNCSILDLKAQFL